MKPWIRNEMSAELNGSSAAIINCIPHNYGARSRGNWTSCSRRVLNDGSGIITELIFGQDSAKSLARGVREAGAVASK
jgi:hypothetical protein